jgi:hypothetical protein
MKELISIGAHCPDQESKKLLLDCLKSLQSSRDKYDILVVSHIPVENYIYDYADYIFYDKNNDILYDLEYLNPPWFSPNPHLKFISSYVTGSNTYLAVYRLLIASFGIARTLGYEKTHWIEYDSYLSNTDFLPINSKHLETNVAVQYVDNLIHNHLAWGYGCIMSVNITKLNPIFLEYNRETLLKLLFENAYKTCESITEEVYLMDGESIYKEDLETLTNKGNIFNLSKKLSKNEMDNWVVPVYNKETNNVEGLVWNNKFETPLNASFIVNNKKIIPFNNISLHSWELKSLGLLDEINNIIIMVNDKIKLKIDFNLVSKEQFKNKSYLYNIQK